MTLDACASVALAWRYAAPTVYISWCDALALRARRLPLRIPRGTEQICFCGQRGYMLHRIIRSRTGHLIVGAFVAGARVGQEVPHAA